MQRVALLLLAFALVACSDQKPAETSVDNKFCKILELYKEQYKGYQSRPDYLDKRRDIVNLHKSRNDDIAALLKKGYANNWRGQITKISSTSDGATVFITMHCGAEIKSYDIKRESTTYSQLRKFQVGDNIKFSGKFIVSEYWKRDGLITPYESSFTINGSMKEPEFRFLLQDVRN